MGEEPRQRTSAVVRTTQILDALSDANHPMTAYELAKSIGAPVSTIYRLSEELIQHDLLSQADGSKLWLGPRLMRYGLLYRAELDFFDVAKREMDNLRLRSGETVQICGRDEGMMVVLAMAEGAGHFRVTSNVGTRVPLNWTASGRLLLGHLPENEAKLLFSEYARPSPTERAETDPAKLAQQACLDFRNGLAIQKSDSEYSVACIAAPIRERNGDCRATISIVLSEKQAEERGDELIEHVKNAALTIENGVGLQS